MVAIGRRAGVTPLKAGQGFARPTANAAGNNLPANNGLWPSTYYSEEDKAGPSPDWPGYKIGGTAGAGMDGFFGPDPRSPQVPPVYFLPGQDPAGMDAGTRNNPGAWRGGIQGFSDKLTVKDRHAFWNTGYQRTGIQGFPPAGSPNTYNNPGTEGPQARLRTVNRTVSYQKGTDTSRNQDDLSRPYPLATGTRGFIGEQGSGYTPVWGGVPGLYQPYGTRGGVPYPIVDPTNGQGGREQVWAGPPHGLHSETFPDSADTLKRYQVLPQMRPVRVDRPSNSPQAGQSYSATTQHQGTPPRVKPGGITQQAPVAFAGRGWQGRMA